MNILRFAPSPTGLLHIGSARVAILNDVIKRKLGGKLLLRIEDTDEVRSTQESINAILEGLKYLEIEFDETILQTSRQAKHIDYAHSLVSQKLAYYAEYEASNNSVTRKANIPKTSVEPFDGAVVRLDIEAIKNKFLASGEVALSDLVYGEITHNTDDIEDFIILRSDKTPTYNFCVVCDDIDMKVSHVVRGSDHLSNTPKQIMLFTALQATIPSFAHIPLMHGTDGKKLSKRRNPVGISDYKSEGFLPESLYTYLATLGYEFESKYNKENVIKLFEIGKLGKSPAQFDKDKMRDINQDLIANMNADILAEKTGLKELQLIDFVKSRSPTLEDLKTLYDTVQNHKTDIKGLNIQHLRLFCDFLQNGNDRTEFKNHLKENGIKFKDIGPQLRMALIGCEKSFPIFDIVEFLGTEECINRINKYL